MKDIITNPKPAAFGGFLLVLPLLFLNLIVVKRIEPFFSLIRPASHTTTLEIVLLCTVLLLLPLGAFIAMRPALRKATDGKRKLYLVNSLLAVLLLIGFVTISGALGSDIYRCDVLQIPNCD